MHGREPTTETRTETKLALALPCKEEEDRKVNHDIKKGVYLTLCSWQFRILQIQIEVKDEATVDVLCGICIFAIAV